MSSPESIPAVAASAPVRLNLEWYRGQARDLLSAFRRGEPAAFDRIRAVMDPALTPPRLHHCQLAVAREGGFNSWRALRHACDLHLATAELAEQLVLHAVDGRPGKAMELLTSRPELSEVDAATACVTGRVDRVRAWLDRDPDAVRKTTGPKGWEPLLYVTFSRLLSVPEYQGGLRQTARLLLDRGADPNAFWFEPTHQARETALFGACGVAYDPVLTRWLLEAGARPDDGGGPGSESLYHACEAPTNDCLRLLLAAGPKQADLDYCLLRKLDFADLEGVELFLAHGCNPNVRHGAHQQTPLMKVASSGRTLEIARALLRAGADPALTDVTGSAAYHHALRHGHLELAELVNYPGAGERLRPVDHFLAAAASGDRNGAEEWERRHPGVRELASRHPFAPRLLVEAARRDDLQPLRTLLALGWDPNGRAEWGTALHQAAWFGCLEAASVLLEHGADPQLRNSYGGTALSTAVYASTRCHHPLGGPTGMGDPRDATHGDYPGLVRLFLNHGAKLGELSDPTTGSRDVTAVLEEWFGPLTTG